jgi:hypothetical protein
MALCLSVAAGRAQEKTFYVVGGGSSISDKASFTELYVPFNSGFAGGYKGIVGIETPLRKSKIWGLEGAVGYGRDNLEVTNLSTSPYNTISYGTTNLRFSGDIVGHAPNTYHGARPYFVFGVEYDRFAPTSAATSYALKNGFASEQTAKLTGQGMGGVNFGGGIDVAHGKKWGLRLDIRDHYTGSPTLGLPSSQPVTTGLAWFPIKGSAYNLEYTIGLTYKFGK